MNLKRDLQNKKGEDQRKNNQRPQLKYAIVYALTALIALSLFQLYPTSVNTVKTENIPYSEFKAKLREGQIVSVTVGGTHIVGQMKNLGVASHKNSTIPFDTLAVPSGDLKLVEELDASGVTYSVQPPPSPLSGFFYSWILPFALIGGIYYFFFRRMGSGKAGGAGGFFGLGKSKSTEVKPEDIKVTYRDVGGADEAIAELEEIIQFLKTPEQFAGLGGRIPKGVLLIGPPGTGKTLLAKATAGEAGVPFFETSGSEFVEMFVGVGAARVRDLFAQAHKSAPAIVFIDEIDAIGQSRVSGSARFGTNDEREQTLNQLLDEIDGFKSDMTNPVIIMAATNRPEILDPALLRAGRFDRQVIVGNPDLIGRRQILRIHCKGIKLASDFDVDQAARMSPGLSGAELANAMNEAALLAARLRHEAVTLKDFEAAMERAVAGLEKKSRVMNEQERESVAYHESGHALIAGLLPHADPVSKISIVPRTRGALGYTMQTPTEDRYLLSKEELQDRIAVMLGGRAAEKVTFNTVTTGASDDIQRATELARRMITEFGMSEKLGSVRYAGQQFQYLGGAIEDNSQISQETRKVVDEETQRIVTEQYERAQELLRKNRGALQGLSQSLLRHESLDGSAVREALRASLGPAATRSVRPQGECELSA
jgi:cell division protease FtsH